MSAGHAKYLGCYARIASLGRSRKGGSPTRSSAAFKRDENLRCAGHYGMDEMFKAASSTADCIKESPQKSNLEHSPFKTRLGTTMFEYYGQNPEHAARFAKAMAGVASGKSRIPPLLGY